MVADGTAFVFPGQGAQRVGMGADLLRAEPRLVGAVFEEADEVLGLPLSRWCLRGPAERLDGTAVTQPAVLVTSVAALTVLRARGVRPDVVAGHSFGEYAALVSAGALDWRDALRLVRRRGLLVAEAGRRAPGAMLAVVGLDLATVEKLCAEVTATVGESVEVANDNEPRQVVVAGRLSAIAAMEEAAKAAGAGRVRRLGVSAAVHCGLMADAERAFAAAVDATPPAAPRLPVFSGVTAGLVRTGEEAAAVLRRQLTSRVRWTETVRAVAAAGAVRFVEVGNGQVVGRLCRRIIPSAAVFHTSTSWQLADALAATGGAVG
ncbi:[acyl-carrier-protein] S-malonyltransferase [Amycolatopsis lurida]|uniref:Malonyl CoA-acyl carrier protein transacylase n=1 Tax=Amycolatopsis lurida NRRL 2430 TaxID=1460371 RepID=A0A2P2FW42_AMYLU|nr:ACP S-malonyltransferase [Amycolatopsis lurida]KFU80940.1 hypothetical protein BB31_13405 [Amycolatopsis lurida NRRL 2430]SED90551.1 [acyl-carrier-protein] S-malonyltransferase [Amycolatopsis lurida]